VLNLLRDSKILSDEEAERWKAYPLLLSSHSDYSGTAEYFIEYVRRQLEDRFGPELYISGYRIYTTLDLDMQQAAEQALAARLEAIESGMHGKFSHPTYQQFLDKAERGDADSRSMTPYLQGLVVSLDAKTGYIRAMVGGRDFEDSKFNRATQALLQPGSTFKPIVYAAAVEAGYPLSHVMVDDSFTFYGDSTQEPWTPQNYDLEFKGPMTLREALYRSQNTIAIKLGMELGPQAVISEATRFGLTTKIHPYPSIYIGSAEVIPLELIAAYTTFANLGTRSVPNAVLRVEDRSGKIVWQPSVRTVRVMDTEHAWLMTDVLRDVVRRGTAATTVGSQLRDLPAGGKTGTTNDGNDVWFIGFTPDLVTGVWIGFDRRQKIITKASGGVLAAPAWTAMMREVYDRRNPPAAWPRPAGLLVLDIDKTNGFKATPFCPGDVQYFESFVPGTEPTGFCPVHSPFSAGGNPMGAAPGADHPRAPRSQVGAPSPGVMGGAGPAPTPHR
jgi:penicillin-binding protein 1A